MRKMLFTLIGCTMIAAASYGQVIFGLTGGLSGYRWDRNPAVEGVSEKNSSGGIFGEILGLNLGLGNEKCRFLLEGYESYSPFTFNAKKFKGMGTFSGGAMARLSITPFGDSWDGNKGFSVGAGLEAIRTDLHFQKKDTERDWFPVKYVYVAYSSCKENNGLLEEMNIFGKL
ncbi:MAG: hypothetical protein LBT42_00135, partial [Tannerella sp.]|nr:hypothetical protein [Tannerella sp.]